ncbi:olfactory receptor 7C1-like [Tenrec ecaudatus]|uniref:olfactory receptor 7C1-like n=1 Tax=Tenrec ecaudatus TaxID=94439 RepID=UPI003F59C9CA
METRNQTGIENFLLLGFAEEVGLKPFLLALFLSMYLITFTGNLLIILAIISDSHLHTPMYFFLSNLSFADICFTSTTMPKMLLNMQTQNKIITYSGCLTQIFFFIVFGCLDNLLLTSMAYDRFVAICHPLHYAVIMNPQLCRLLTLGSWCLSVMGSLLETLTILRLSFCARMEIPHFFCDLPEVLKLSCSNTLINNIVVYFVTGVLAVFPLSGILFSYSQIVSSILSMSAPGGKYKAFSTCGSHLTVVFLFYGTGLGVYLTSAATASSQTSLIASVMYTMVTPMLNPFIYSLRNRDIKRALAKLLEHPGVMLTELLDAVAVSSRGQSHRAWGEAGAGAPDRFLSYCRRLSLSSLYPGGAPSSSPASPAQRRPAAPEPEAEVLVFRPAAGFVCPSAPAGGGSSVGAFRGPEALSGVPGGRSRSPAPPGPLALSGGSRAAPLTAPARCPGPARRALPDHVAGFRTAARCLRSPDR